MVFEINVAETWIIRNYREKVNGSMMSDMEMVLKYGTGSTVPLRLDPPELIGAYGRPRQAALDDPAAAVAAALVDPLDFPPLKMAIAPGDRIALALADGLPCAAQLVAGVVASLLEAGAKPEEITVLQACQESNTGWPDPRCQLPASVRRRVSLVTHDPTQRDELGYLAASAAGEPIYVNRVLWDADVVLPIGCLRLESHLDYGGAFGGLFPTFSDQATQQRFRAAGNYRSAKRRQLRLREADEAGWWLGVSLAIQVVPGPGDSILHVLAGNSGAIYQRGRRLCREAWYYRSPRRASLVVAGIEGAAACQTWENVGRALAAAMNLVEDEGAIAICSDLAAAPGTALLKITQAESRDLAYRQIRRERSPDAPTAYQLLRALEKNKVYLLSRLADEVVENLGIAPVENVRQIRRLADCHSTCAVIWNAQYVMTGGEGDGASDLQQAAGSATGIGREDQ
ncbi:MAG: DUF2088 domain-containing protein [Planctomycetales bacterium]|nr:DUF2088 domain-containing protein [Planctomycetales bacterium]